MHHSVFVMNIHFTGDTAPSDIWVLPQSWSQAASQWSSYESVALIVKGSECWQHAKNFKRQQLKFFFSCGLSIRVHIHTFIPIKYRPKRPRVLLPQSVPRTSSNMTTWAFKFQGSLQPFFSPYLFLTSLPPCLLLLLFPSSLRWRNKHHGGSGLQVWAGEGVNPLSIGRQRGRQPDGSRESEEKKNGSKC